MPQLRQNPATKEWVIIASERAKRPEDFQINETKESPDTISTCPFCAGNEKFSPGELFAFREYGTKADEPGWRIRVVPNKFPALILGGDVDRVKLNDFFLSMNGFGEHEVIIESPDHDRSMATMDQKQVEEVFLTYKERYNALKSFNSFEMILIFKNHGKYAGTSISHPHSQIVSTPVTPMHMRHKFEEAMRYFDDNGKCVYCEMIKKEIADFRRVIMETDNFVAFVPYAASSPFEIWVLPKHHQSAYNKIQMIETKELGFIMRQTLWKVYKGLKNPAYNFIIPSAPCHEEDLEYFHWHIQIVPRVTSVAGFEMGSGIYINTAIPEESAKFLREVPQTP